MRLRRLAIVGFLVVLTACGSSSKSSGGGGKGTTTTAAAAQDTTLGPGVTDTTMKLGIWLIDFSCIKTFTDNIRINQQSYYDAFIKDINEKQGGVAGRQIVPDYNLVCPIKQEQAVAGCTKFTDDDKVFAVTGVVYDPAGDVQACLAKKHKTPLVSFEVTQAIMDKSPPGMIVLPGGNPESVDPILVKFLKNQNTLAGKKVAVLGGAQNKKSITTSLVPALKTLGVPLESPPTILNIGTTGVTTDAQTQLDSFISLWNRDNVGAIFITGDEAVSKQFVEKIKAKMPNVMLITDTNTARDTAREEQAAGKNPNPYEGILSTSGPTSAEYDASVNWKYCADIYKAQTGKDAPSASAVIKTPDGKNTNDVHASISDPCQLLFVIKQIGDKVGKNLNVTNWLNAVNTFGPIVNRGGGEHASLHQGKYDIDDTYRLVAFDSTLGEGGDWKPLTPLENAAG